MQTDENRRNILRLNLIEEILEFMVHGTNST